MNALITKAHLVILTVVLGATAQTTTTSPAPASASATGVASVANRLPIQRVLLYKNGIGYFEHVGPVRGRQDVTISFTSGQLNDVLKSLTVLDLNGGRISGVAYGSQNSLDRQLGELPIAPGEAGSLAQLLGTLRGARVEIRSGATAAITGRLLSVERKPKASGDAAIEADYVTVLTEAGELRSVEVSPAANIRLLEKDLAQKVGRYLDVVSQEREPDLRTMTISAEGTGPRNLFVSYISEVPVWKSTYRVVFGDDAKKNPLLQGWAIVDNTVGQDWENVELSLVSGAPQSFIQNLSEPLYTQRPVIGVSSAAMTAPQTHEATLRMGRASLQGTVTDPSGAVVPGTIVRAYDSNDQLVGETLSGADGRYQFTTLPDGTIRVEFSSPGFQTQRVHGLSVASSRSMRRDAVLQLGSVTESVAVSEYAGGVSSYARIPAPGASRAQAMGKAAAVASPNLYASMANLQGAASTQELGDLFEYKLKERLSIQKNQSALVPITQAEIKAERVSLWNRSLGSKRPMRALWINNSTGITLDGGTFNVIEGDAFAGEGIFESIRPDERRLVTYATDLALNVNGSATSESDQITRVRIYRGVLIHDSERRAAYAYTFRNEDTKPRTVIIEHPIRAGYKLLGSLKAEEETDQWRRFRLVIGPKETKSLPVQEAWQQPTSYQLTNIDSNLIAMFVRQNSITPEIEAALRRIIEQKRAIAVLSDRQKAWNTERDKIFQDQSRVRENMKSLKGSAEEKALLQRYTEQLNAQEDRVQALDVDLKKVATDLTNAREELERLITTLSFNEEIKQG